MKAQAISQFVKLYGREPKWIVSAPGRVNIIGEHTDYNDGFVFPMALERRTVIAAAPAEPSDGLGENEAKIWTSAGEQTGVVSVAPGVAPTEDVPWTAYIQGTLTLCAEAGFPAQPFVAVMLSDVPLGGGLSSSAALEVSVATLCEAISGKTMDPVKKCLLCQKAEHEFAHMPCGIMDQFISNLGQPDHAMLLDCRSCVPEMVPLTDPAVSILIINSNVKALCTTDDPADTLEWHRKLAEEGFEVKVLPSYRPDKAVALEKPDYLDYLAKLGNIDSYDKLVAVLKEKLEFFVESGCRVTDHGVDAVPYAPASDEEVAAIFAKRLAGEMPTALEAKQFKTALMLALAKESGITRAIETCGSGSRDFYTRAAELGTTFLYDLKCMDPARHKELVGADNKHIIENLLLLFSMGADVIIRLPMIPGCNDSDGDIAALADFLKEHEGSYRYAELMPYHPLGVGKSEKIGSDQEYRREAATDSEIDRWVSLFAAHAITVKVSK